MQTLSAEPGKACRWLSPVLLRSAEAVNLLLDFGCLVQSVINDKCTLQGLASDAGTALKPRPAPREMVRVAFTQLHQTQRSSGCAPFPASCSLGRQSQSMHAVLGIVRLSMQCPCLAAVPFSCPLLGNSPHITSWQPHLAFQLQPARMIRSFDSPISISAVEAWD